MDYIIVWVWPLCGGEAQEEEEAHQEDEGDGAADVGHRPHRWDGDRHLLLGPVHPDLLVRGRLWVPSSRWKFLQMINFPLCFSDRNISVLTLDNTIFLLDAATENFHCEMFFL